MKNLLYKVGDVAISIIEVEASEGEEKIIKIYHYYNNKHIDYLFGGTPASVYEIHMNREGLE